MSITRLLFPLAMAVLLFPGGSVTGSPGDSSPTRSNGFVSGAPVVTSTSGTTAADQSESRCSVCNSRISGRYLEYEGQVYCSQACLDRDLPHCSVCGKVLQGKYLTRDGQLFCGKNCFRQDLPHCSVCGDAIEGRYTERDGEFFCSDRCLRTTLPQCTVCSQPISSWVEMEDKIYCKSCAGKPRCFACGHPRQTVALDDGRLICSTCRKTALFREKEAHRLFHQVRRALDRKLGLSTVHEIQLLLVGRDELEKLDPGASRGVELGYFHYSARTETTYTVSQDTLGRETREITGEETEAVFRILLLYGLPKNRFIEVAAHELAHDWMQAHLPGIRDPLIEEGFAEFVASRVNILFDNPDMNQRMSSNQDPVYGDGYRLMEQRYDENGGLPGLIASLRRDFTR